MSVRKGNDKQLQTKSLMEMRNIPVLCVWEWEQERLYILIYINLYTLANYISSFFFSNFVWRVWVMFKFTIWSVCLSQDHGRPRVDLMGKPSYYPEILDYWN